ncbi:MAG TPA: hypothetical protein DET40_09595 [Lentisphaeria bacterium]|nr:MAG: hypothetical protein A2X45_08380 [Lentisphaerae bacterium GWF2_50_93]HCE43789.1 hypothetical protein [Lentisphaeria bacterium]
MAGRMVLVIMLAALGAYLAVRPDSWTPFAPLDLVAHEVGHPLFSFFGEWMTYAGGTILQHLVPLIALIILLKQDEYFGIPLCGAWFAVNLYETARYIADTRSQVLPLVTLGTGDEPAMVKFTDWEYLLDRIPGLSIEYDTNVALAVRIFAFLAMWSSIGFGVWMLWVMHKKNQFRPELEEPQDDVTN